MLCRMAKRKRKRVIREIVRRRGRTIVKYYSGTSVSYNGRTKPTVYRSR